MFPTGRTVARFGPSSAERAPDPSERELLDLIHADTGPSGNLPADTDLCDLGNGPARTPDPRREFHARPGHRPGATPGITSARLGGYTDVVRPLLVAPGTASRIVLAGEVFEVPLPHLRIDTDGLDTRLLVLAVAIVGEGQRPIPATLHLLGSPSMVVTVLELVPARRLRWGRERFLRYGVEAIDALAHRIERAA